MPQIHLFLVFLFSASLLVAQDTVRVQTFTWEDETRSKMFQFPDTDDTYEQILMRYNMRCHDADIRTDNRGGYFGCGEWDYSCNTFVYDPTREDSVKATHPSHLISGFDGDEFVYRDTPPYEYYQYTQYVSNFVDTSSLTVGEIGAAGPGDDRLFANQVLRWQYLYRAEELLAAGLSAGPISAMQLYVTSGGADLNFLRLSLQNVSVDSLSEDEPITTGFTQVYFRTTRLEGEGSWQSFPFYESFYWDGESNLLLNVSMKSSGVEEEVRHTSQTTDFLSATAPVPEEPDYYLALNGNGWMELDIASGPATEEITIAFWAKGLAAALGRNTSVFEGVDGLGQRQLNVHFPWSNNRIYWDCGNDGTGYDRIDKAADPSILAGQWNHWAFTKDAVSGEMAIYLNGELWHSGTGKHRPISGLERTVFGANANYANRWPGGIDHVSFTASALSAEEIRAIMFKQRPSIAEVGAHFSLNEGDGLTAAANSPSYTAQLFGPNWQEYAPEDQRFDWYVTPFRWHVRFDQGQHLLQNEPISVLDSQLVSPLTVREFAVNTENDLVQTREYETYPVHTFVYNEDGEVIDDNYVSSDGIIYINELDYHRKTPAKFEILSLVTPYGIGLDLGNAGKTFTFDVTDYAPILRGEKRLSLEMGGQNQEEMNIEFLFIKGTPSREVLDIANVWPFARGNYAAVQADEVFEPRNMRLDPAAGAYKLRASITGHGQNGEFIPRQHYLNLNGGAQDFQFDVWKACSQNPVYPQGGTWIFDRAGWCPGMATDVHEYFLPEDIGTAVEVDYGVNGATMDQANYLVATQLVTYGPRNFALDAKVVDIIRPSKKVEYERINPICDDPVIRVRNTGGTSISSMRIAYGPTGNEAQIYDWEGSLAPDEETEVVLPVDYYRFWTDVNFDARFQVELTAVNGTTDDYSANNVMITDFEPTEVFDFDDPLIFEFQTNLRPGENRYTITNAAGEVVMQRANLTASTRYRETIDLPPGCYRLTFFDEGGDGLDFWYWAAIGQSRGTGSLSIRRQITPNLLPILHRFNADYGGDLYYDFIIPDLVDNTDELTEARRFSVYPNPARSHTVLELTGFAGETLSWSLHTTQGVAVAQGVQQALGDMERLQLDLDDLPAGIYLAKVKAGEEWFTQEVVVLP